MAHNEWDLGRKETQWFLYRNPTPSTLEIWAIIDGYNYYAPVNGDCNIEPIWFEHKPDYYANCYNGKIGRKEEFSEMLKTVKMLAKWKQAHAEKE